MFKPNLRAAQVALGVAVLVSACGGSGSDGGSGSLQSPSATTGDSPSGQTVSALMAFAEQQIAATSDTTEPVVVGDAELPIDDTADLVD